MCPICYSCIIYDDVTHGELANMGITICNECKDDHKTNISSGEDVILPDDNS